MQLRAWHLLTMDLVPNGYLFKRRQDDRSRQGQRTTSFRSFNRGAPKSTHTRRAFQKRPFSASLEVCKVLHGGSLRTTADETGAMGSLATLLDKSCQYNGRTSRHSAQTLLQLVTSHNGCRPRIAIMAWLRLLRCKAGTFFLRSHT